MAYAVVGVVGLLLLLAVVAARGRKAAQVVIYSPILGILNLSNEEGDQMASQDLSTLGSLFRTVRRDNSRSPACDVLLIYCDIGADGKIQGTRTLGQLIAEAGARIAVIANDHDGETYSRAAKALVGPVNLVMTVERNGNALSMFLADLFRLMQNGTPMPEAWITLAPQIPGADSKYGSSSLCLINGGQIVFRLPNPAAADERLGTVR